MKAERLFDMSGQAAIVTGAAGGLGLAIAEVLVENGARVMMADIDGARLERAAAALRARALAVETSVVDVADSDRLCQVTDETVVRFGRLDVAVANAGISAGPGFSLPGGGIDAVSMAKWDEVLQVNLTSVFVTMQAAAAHMKPRRQGRIIVISSIGGMQAEPLVGYAYAATKAAVNNLVRQAALELAPHNVLVNAIAPGPFLTDIAGGRLHTHPEIVARFESMVPLGRIARAEEIKGLALLLASPASSFMTGTVIPIDGGATAG